MTRSWINQFLHYLELCWQAEIQLLVLYIIYKKVEFELGLFKILYLSLLIPFGLLFADFEYIHFPEAYRCWLSRLTSMNGADI